MAESNVATAKLLKRALKDDTTIMQSLSASLGEKDALKVKGKIDKAAKRTLLYRLRTKVLGHKHESLSECVKSVIRTLTHEGYRDLAKIKEAKKALKEEKKDKHITKEEYKKQKAELNKAAKDIKKEKLTAKDKLDTVRFDKQVLRNPHTGGVAKTVRDAYIQGKLGIAKDKTKSKVGEWVADHITDRDRKKRDKKDEYKSAIDFITGKDSRKDI